MRRLIALSPLLALALLACRPATIPPSQSLASEEAITVTGVGIIDLMDERPYRPEQVYPQVRIRALEHALDDAQGQMLATIAATPVSGQVRLGDMMSQHRSVQLLAEDLVHSLPIAESRWMWDDELVEVDLRLLQGELQQFIASLPLGYLTTTEPGLWQAEHDVAADLPAPTSAPEQFPEVTAAPEAPNVGALMGSPNPE